MDDVGWWGSVDWSALGREEDPVLQLWLRRDFLTACLAIGTIPWRERGRAAMTLANSIRAERQQVEWLDGLTHELAAQWNDGHPARLQRRLTGLQWVVGEMASQSPGYLRNDLGQIAGRIAILRGLVYRFLNQDDAAKDILGIADAWGEHVGDNHLRAVAAVFRADIDSTVQAGLSGPSPRSVRQLLTAAERWAGTSAPAAIQALILNRQAEEYAAIRWIDDAFRYLELSDRAWATAPDPGSGLYGIAWSNTMQRAFWANVVVLVGQPRLAVPILTDVIESSVGSNAIAATTDLASALARLGDVDHAAELLQTALVDAHAGGLADRSRRIYGVFQRDLACHQQVPAVARLREALTSR